eukprot:6459788-Amphidinium_carterae.1
MGLCVSGYTRPVLVSDCKEVRLKAGTAAPEDNHRCARAHLWARRLSLESIECEIVAVRSHQPEPDRSDEQAWITWKGNSLADHYARLAAEQHPAPTIAGQPALRVAGYLMELAHWIGFQQAMLARGTLSDYE